jgi:hypothetical protein
MLLEDGRRTALTQGALTVTAILGLDGAADRL